jgi:hypothetical protein
MSHRHKDVAHFWAKAVKNAAGCRAIEVRAGGEIFARQERHRSNERLKRPLTVSQSHVVSPLPRTLFFLGSVVDDEEKEKKTETQKKATK